MVTSLKRLKGWQRVVPRESCPRMSLHGDPSALPPWPVSAPCDSVTVRTAPLPLPASLSPEPGCTPTVADAQSVDADGSAEPCSRA